MLSYFEIPTFESCCPTFDTSESVRPEMDIKSAASKLMRVRHRQLVSKMFPAAETLKTSNSALATGSISHKLMISHHLIQPASAGTFYFLPALTRSLEKLYRLIDAEMKNIGAEKVALPCLAPQQLWQSTERWNVMGSELFELTDRNGSHHCLAPTHEEAITSVVAAQSPVSISRLPIKLYQISRKFRDEGRPKHGLLRCREFEMKDLYTFDKDSKSAEETYEQVCDSYSILLDKLQLPFMSVEASTGAMGGQKSREFHLASPMGEDVILTCESCKESFNQELQSKEDPCHVCGKSTKFIENPGIEVAHAFLLGTKYSEVLNAHYVDNNEKKISLYMGCFGIGVTRLLAASIEVLSADNCIKWPSLIAPYQICIIPQKEGYKSEVTRALADSLYDELSSVPGLQSEIVIDDRLHLSIGHRIKDCKASGFPHLLVLGKKALESEAVIEHIDTVRGTSENLSQSQIIHLLSQFKTIPLS